MRRLLLLGLAACDGSSAQMDAAVDADVCARAAAVAPATCQRNALATLSLDGTWTLTGTRQLDAGSEAYTSPITIARSGTGWCQLNVAFSPTVNVYRDPTMYVDDTFASHLLVGGGLQPSMDSWTLCVEGSGELAFHEQSMYVMGGYQHWLQLDGVLTR